MDNKFFRFFRKTRDVIVINILWLVCCIPVVTIGASCAAMYRAVFDLREGKSGCAGNFFRGFRKCFVLATKVWLTLAVAVVAVFGVSRLVGFLQMQLISTVTVAAASAALLIGWLLMVCVFPLVAYFDTTLKKTMRNAAFIAIKHRKQAITSAVLSAIPVVILLVVPDIFLVSSGVWMLIFPGAMAYFIASRFAPILLAYGNKRKEKLKSEEKE